MADPQTPDPEDQEALAADWAAMAGVEEEGEADPDEALAADWAEAMTKDDLAGAAPKPVSPPPEATGRVLSQDEIDSLLGFDGSTQETARSGIDALINSNDITYERLPMLEVVFDRLERIMTTSVRNFTSENVDINLENITAQRFGDYLNSVPLPAMITVFKAIQWDNFGLITADSALIYAIVDVLLGGRRGTAPMRIEGRPYTTIEQRLVERLVRLILSDLTQAFAPIVEVDFRFERMETNPRFAAIARPGNACVVFRMRIDLEDRGGTVEFLLPYATLEPARDLLLQMFMGEKFGRDSIWESHLSREIWQTTVDLEAVLDEYTVMLGEIMHLKVGDVLHLNTQPESSIVLRCGSVPLLRARVGKVRNRLAVHVEERIRNEERDG